jgi:hypothetical protein
MASDFDPMKVLMRDGPIPPVDPVDIKKVYLMMEEYNKKIQRPDPAPEQNAGSAAEQSNGIGVNPYTRICSQGADVGAVVFRVWMTASMSGMRQLGNEERKTEFPWIHDGRPSDAFFKAVAIVPMTGPLRIPLDERTITAKVSTVKVVGKKLAYSTNGPFDPEELFRLIKEAESTT